MMKHKRVNPGGHQTSVRLEPVFWELLTEIRGQLGFSLNEIIELVFIMKPRGRSLASAIRVFVAEWFHPYPGQYHEMRCHGRTVPGRDGKTVYGLPGPTQHFKPEACFKTMITLAKVSGLI
jgi:predicted DNA-binding ribbon-helix-helix protein